MPPIRLDTNFIVAAPEETLRMILARLPPERNKRLFFYVLVPVSDGRYIVVSWDAIEDIARETEQHLLDVAIIHLPGLPQPVASAEQSGSSPERLRRQRDTQPGKRLVVLHSGEIAGVLAVDYRQAHTSTDDPFQDAHAPPKFQPYLNTRFDGVAADGALVVSQIAPLWIWVGEAQQTTASQSSRRFAFAFPQTEQPVPYEFLVHVDADPEMWQVVPAQPRMIVLSSGQTQQQAVFLITPRKPGEGTLHIAVEQAETGATVQHVWLPIVAVDADQRSTHTVDTAGSRERTTTALPLDTRTVKRRSVELNISAHDKEGFEAVVRADLPESYVRETYCIPVSGAAIQNATAALRQALKDVVLYRTIENGVEVYPFADAQTYTVDENVARAALVRLADVGQQVWQVLFGSPRAPTKLRQLAADLRTLPAGSTVQIIIESQEFIVPWALLYDKPGEITPETVEWSGFWGYRYILDVLPPGAYPTPELEDMPPIFRLLLNDDMRLHRFTNAQEQFVKTHLASATAHLAWGNTAAKQHLAAAANRASLLYCYCHGKQVSGVQQIGLLPSESALLFSENQELRLIDLHRLPAAALQGRPLVFLNACEGATQDAFYYEGFMPFFLEKLDARGFIGTEVIAPQLLAHDFALRFLEAFASGHPVGEILWHLRRYYLDEHHNILAFNYSLYCLSEVRLAQPLFERKSSA
jgi:hypothetical protein